MPAVVELGPWAGGITPTSAVVKLKLARAGWTMQLLVSKKPDLSQSVFSHTDISDDSRNRIVTIQLGDLEPDTSYFYALHLNGHTDRSTRGRLRTFPASGSASFTFAFGSCARTASSNRVFTTILENQPLFYMNVGDWHYLNITNDSQDEFRVAYQRVWQSPTQAQLYRFIPFVYVWDDHDFGGNNSTGFAASRAAARSAYQEHVPHYPLGAGDGDIPIFQAFSVGRVRFLVTDLRSERSPSRDRDGPRKSMMGSQQKAWFKKQLLAAKDKYPLIFWVSSVPWIGIAGDHPYPLPTNYFGYVHSSRLPEIPDGQTPTSRRRTEDHWSVYATERNELANFIKENRIGGVAILHGDAHMLGADDGSNGDYADGGGARIPVMCAGALDQNASIKGGPYSQGVYKPAKGEGCFGLVRVNDTGGKINVTFSGRNHLNAEKVSLKFEVKP